MLTEPQIKALLVARIIACTDSCNSFHINHVSGQIRALLAVLTDGSHPTTSSDTPTILRLAGIPFTLDDDGWEVDDEWLKANLPPAYKEW